MKIKRCLLLPLIFAFVLTFNLNASAKDDWLRVQSKNFELVGNASDKEMRRVATKLEQFRIVFKTLFSRMNFISPIPTRVVIFKDAKSFKFFKTNEWVAGYFQPGEDMNYIVLSTEGEKEDLYRVIFHEYTHFLMDNSLGRSSIPPWFNEGIAEYYEQFRIANDQNVTMGGLNNDHLTLLFQNKLIPFETFFAIDNYSLHKQTKQSAGLFYAQSWAFLHYLMHSENGARKKQMGIFIDLLLQGKQPKYSFEQAFQTDYAKMEAELKNYINQKSFKIILFSFNQKLVFDNEMQTFPLGVAEAKAIQGDLLYHTHRFDDAEKYLLEALALDENSSFANTSLGLVKMRQNKFSEAKNYLEKAIRSDAKNFMAHYTYAFVLSREEMTENGFASGFSVEQSEKIRTSLNKAIALNPNFAESYSLLAFVNIVRNEQINESIQIITKALTIAPGNQWYQMRLAELYMRAENFSAARNIVQKVVLTAADDNLKLYAENTLTRMNSYESQLNSLRNGNRGTDESITEKPMSPEELAIRNSQANNESLNNALRIPKADEQRFHGFVTNIECAANEIIFTVKTGDKKMRLRSGSFENVQFISFDESFVNSEIGCGVLKDEMSAVITYRPVENAKSKSQGELIAVEIVPKTFRLL